MSEVKDRIVEVKKIGRADLVLHPAHEWIHTEEQKALLADFTKRRGSTSVIYVRHHPTIAGKFEILDGKMRFENLELSSFWCAVTDLTDEEALQEVQEHNVIPHMAVTVNPRLLALMKSVGIPDVSNLLKDAPSVDGKPANQPVKKEEREAKAAVKEAKAEPELKCVYVLTVLPLSKFGEARPHLAALESMAEVTVQRSGEEPVAN